MITYSSCSCESLLFPQSGPLGSQFGTQKIRIKQLMTGLWRNGLWNLASILQECGSIGRVIIQFSRGALCCLHYKMVHQTAISFLISNTISNFYNKKLRQYSIYTTSFWFSLSHFSVAPQSPLMTVPCTSKSESSQWTPLFLLHLTFSQCPLSRLIFPFYFTFPKTVFALDTAFFPQPHPNNHI